MRVRRFLALLITFAFGFMLSQSLKKRTEVDITPEQAGVRYIRIHRPNSTGAMEHDLLEVQEIHSRDRVFVPVTKADMGSWMITLGRNNVFCDVTYYVKKVD